MNLHKNLSNKNRAFINLVVPSETAILTFKNKKCSIKFVFQNKSNFRFCNVKHLKWNTIMKKWLGWKLKVDYSKKRNCNKTDITITKEVVRYISGLYHMFFDEKECECVCACVCVCMS